MEDLVTECLQLMDHDQVDALQDLLQEGQVTTEVALDNNSPAQSLLLAAIVKRKPESVALLLRHHPQLTVLLPTDGGDGGDGVCNCRDYIYPYEDVYDKISLLSLQELMSWAGMTELTGILESKYLSKPPTLLVDDVSAQCVALKLIYAKQYLALRCLLKIKQFEKSDMQNFLQEAMKRTGSSVVVEELLRGRIALAEHTHDSTLLLQAAYLPDDHILMLLVRYGASVEGHNLNQDALVESTDSRDDNKQVLSRFADPLMCAISQRSQRAVARLIGLIAAHVDANPQELPLLHRRWSTDISYLTWALFSYDIHTGHVEHASLTNSTIGIIKELIGHGCDINHQDSNYQKDTILQAACLFKQPDIIRFLIKSYTLSNEASKIHGHKAIINYGLINEEDKSVLCDLIEKADIETVTLFLSLNITLDTAASEPRRSPLFAAVCSNSIDKCKLLIQKGFDVNVPGLLGAVIQLGADNEILELLLRSGADPNLYDREGRPCIQYRHNEQEDSVKRPVSSENLFSMIILLLRYGKRFSEDELSDFLLLNRGIGVWIMLLEQGVDHLRFSECYATWFSFMCLAILLGRLPQICVHNYSSLHDPAAQDLVLINAEPFSLKHWSRLAVRRQIHTSIPVDRLDQRVSCSIMCSWSSLHLPTSMLDYLLFLELGSIQGGSSDSLYPPIYGSVVQNNEDSETARAMENYLDCMKDEMTCMSEQTPVVSAVERKTTL